MIPLRQSAWLAAALWLASTVNAADEPDFFDDDALWFDPEKQHRQINGGDLVFLNEPPAEKVHHHHNSIEVDPASLKHGWIRLQQCHMHLDHFPRAEVVFHATRIRNLAVTESRNIEAAQVQGHSVQLTNVGEDARLCIEAESRALHANGDGTFTLRNGPFMRRFLDGYFPMRVSMRITLPENLQLVDSDPDSQPGFVIDRHDRGFGFDAWFEGRLVTEFLLKTSDPVPL